MERGDWAWKAFLPEGANRNHEAAHVFDSIKAGIEEAFPPALVVVGGFDPLHDWQLRYYEALKEKGKQVRLVEYPDAIHAFYVLPKHNDTTKVMEEMKGFVQANRSI
ncbi:putative carboxylesterase 18 [Carex littledalei]|uniref:Putative carboxylesterase 18 n=1 Tax=Carex littledalei TaxID=544730 RepID=A0A833QTG0_9POAL|nr:putative carboxylesterase 18 [Carex littledalei]